MSTPNMSEMCDKCRKETPEDELIRVSIFDYCHDCESEVRGLLGRWNIDDEN